MKALLNKTSVRLYQFGLQVLASDKRIAVDQEKTNETQIAFFIREKGKPVYDKEKVNEVVTKVSNKFVVWDGEIGTEVVKKSRKKRNELSE